VETGRFGNTALYSDKVKGKQDSTVLLLIGTASNIPDVFFFLPMPENKMHLGFASMDLSTLLYLIVIPITTIQSYLASPKFICCPKNDVKSLIIWATGEGLLAVEQTMCYYFFR